MNYKDEALRFLEVSKIQLSQLQKEYFVTTCEANELNPFKKDIYSIGSGANTMFVVSYDAYLKRADTQPDRGGEEFETITDENGNLKAIRCNVYKINKHTHQRYKFLDFEALLSEFKGNTPLWRTKPMVMLRKCSHANALRQAYPTMWNSLVYAEEEISEVTPAVENTVQPEPTPPPAFTNPVANQIKANTKPIELNQPNDVSQSKPDVSQSKNETIQKAFETLEINKPIPKQADEVKHLDFFNDVNKHTNTTELNEKLQAKAEIKIEDYDSEYKKQILLVLGKAKSTGNQKWIQKIKDYFKVCFNKEKILGMEEFAQLQYSVKEMIFKDIEKMLEDMDDDEMLDDLAAVIEGEKDE